MDKYVAFSKIHNLCILVSTFEGTAKLFEQFKTDDFFCDNVVDMYDALKELKEAVDGYNKYKKEVKSLRMQLANAKKMMEENNNGR